MTYTERLAAFQTIQQNLPVLAPTTPAGAQLGVSGWVDPANPGPTLDQIVSFGLGWVRPTAQEWSWVEPTQGQPNWTQWSAITAAAHARGLKVVATALGTPAWASAGDVNGKYPPKDFPSVAAFAGYAKGLIDHGGDLLEIWNEPNWQLFWQPQPDPNGYQFLTAVTVGQVRAAYPNLPIITGGLSPSGTDPLTFLQQAFPAGSTALNGVTGIGLHPYTTGLDPQSQTLFTTTWDALSAAGGGRPIYVTEAGCSTADVSELAQAGYFSQMYLQAAAKGCPLFISYRMQDQTPASRENNYGFVRADGTCKPAGQVVKRATS